MAGLVAVGDVKLYRAEFGNGEPVLFLHGGLAHANYWGHQIAAVARRRRVIIVDTRGHGRSLLSARPFSYSLLATDAVALLDALGIARAAVVGWSDGAIVGLHLAMHQPERLSRLFAFAANFNHRGVRGDGARSPLMAAYNERCRLDYLALSPAADNWTKLVAGLRAMWASEPNYSPQQLAHIRIPTAIIAAEHDEIILRAHSEALAAAIPGATFTMLPGVSHFAMLQDSGRFTAAVEGFLGG